MENGKKKKKKKRILITNHKTSDKNYQFSFHTSSYWFGREVITENLFAYNSSPRNCAVLITCLSAVDKT